MHFQVEDEMGQRFILTYFGAHEPFDAYVAERYGSEEVDRLYEAKGTTVRLSIVYYPDLNEYQGRQELQFVMSGYC